VPFTQAFQPLEAHPPRAEPVYADSPPTAAIRDNSRAAHEPPVPGHPVAMKRKVALLQSLAERLGRLPGLLVADVGVADGGPNILVAE
jgi:hypothetical protein